MKKIELFDRKKCALRPPSEQYGEGGDLRSVSIHHGGPVGGPINRFASAASMWREFQRFHMEQRHWVDIGYHFGVDGRGRLYEGRPLASIPAAVAGHNQHMAAICFMQDGDRWGMTWLQKQMMEILFRDGLPDHGLPPLTGLVHRAGREYGVFGHCEYVWGQSHEANACPGRILLADLRRMRADL